MLSSHDDGALKLWDVWAHGDAFADRRPVLRSRKQGHAEAITACVFSPGKRLIITASRDRTMRTWDGETGRALATLGHRGWVEACAFTPDGDLVLSGDSSME